MSLTIAPGAIVCNECQLVGEISIGTRTVVHPKAQIIAEAGPIIIGENNMIEERARIINAKDPNNTETTRVMIIGNNNVFEVDSTSYALKIGDFNNLEAKSVVGKSTVLTNGCIIGDGCKVLTEEAIPENCVIYGSKNDRRVQGE